MNDVATHLRNAEFSPQASARLAGFFYLVVIVAGAIAEIFVRQRLVIRPASFRESSACF